jgi:hypothetical protein
VTVFVVVIVIDVSSCDDRFVKWLSNIEYSLISSKRNWKKKAHFKRVNRSTSTTQKFSHILAFFTFNVSFTFSPLLQ